MIPLGIGLTGIKSWGKLYCPFFILLLLGFLSELISFIVINNFKAGNAPVIKIYSLIECCLVLYQLYLWGNKKAGKRLFLFSLFICVAVWLTDNIFFLNINNFSPYFRVFYAFVIVLLSITQINAIMVKPDGLLYKNPKFIISFAFIIFFIYQIIYEASFYIGSDKSIVANKIILGFAYINFGVNMLYAVAAFLITRKNEAGFRNSFSEG